MKLLFSVFVSTLAILIFANFGCSKDKDQFRTIQSSIQGKWKLEYAKGGIAGTTQYYNDSYYTFTSNRILIVTNGIVHADTKFEWTKQVGVNSGGNYVYIMSFYDKQNVPWNYVVDGVINDSLVLHDNASDAFYYHFSRN